MKKEHNRHKKWMTAANTITLLRIAGTIGLLFPTPMSPLFLGIYTLTGLTDVLDGWIARKTGTASEFGAKLNSIADLLFYAVMLLRLFPALWEALPIQIWYAVAGVLLVRLAAYCTAAIKYHRFAFPIIMGVNEPQYTDAELEAFRKANEEGVTFEGRHYTIYEATQRQRKFERTIRKQKRRILVDEATGDKDKLQNDQIRLQVLKQNYARFSKGVGLPMQHARMETAGFDWKKGKAAEEVAKYKGILDPDESQTRKQYERYRRQAPIPLPPGHQRMARRPLRTGRRSYGSPRPLRSPNRTPKTLRPHPSLPPL